MNDKTRKIDPLEALKRGEDGKPLDPLDAPTTAIITPQPVAVAPKPKPPPAVKAPPQPKVEYVLKTDAKYVDNGQVVKIKAGTTIDAAGFGGAPGIARLRSMGVQLEEVVPTPAK